MFCYEYCLIKRMWRILHNLYFISFRQAVELSHPEAKPMDLRYHSLGTTHSGDY